MSTDAMRAALKRMANAADAVGVAHFDSDDLSPEVEELQRSTEEARAALAQPVSAERVPLTDEQLTDIWNASLLKPQSVYAFARAIERAHGITGETE